MNLGFSIVSYILFITKHKSDNNFGPNLNIDKILSMIDSPGHSREVSGIPKCQNRNTGNCWETALSIKGNPPQNKPILHVVFKNTNFLEMNILL